MAPSLTGRRSDDSMLVCGLCGVAIAGSYLRTGLGEAFCARHRHGPACRFCGAPVADLNQALCRGCQATAVFDQQEVKRTLPGVRTGLHAMGLRLAVPVQVKLLSEAQMARHPYAPARGARGFTVYSGQKVLDLVVVAGLPAVEFGAVVAHECMHAWLAQRGFPELPTALAEGLCQLASYEWLRRNGSDRASLLMAAMETDPDPDYGEGFRVVRGRVRRYGIKAVLAHVRTNGILPE